MLYVGLAAAFLAGLVMIEMALTEPEYELMSRLLMFAFGLVMAAPGVILFVSFVKDAYNKRATLKDDSRKQAAEMAEYFKFLIFALKEVITDDKNASEKLIRVFRKDYDDFFDGVGSNENTPIQSDATQIFWNILSLQKRRLARKNLTMEFESERMKFGTSEPVKSTEYFDGKYEITEIDETVRATRIFKKNGRILKRLKNTEIARFRLLDTRHTDNGMIICPGCGNPADRDNLLDGCDYCNTKFTIEDLGLRVSDFGFRPDYELEYDKFRDFRSMLIVRTGICVGIPIGILSFIGMVKAVFGGGMTAGPIMSIAGVIFGTAFCVFAAIFLIVPLVLMVVFPAIQTFALARYYGRKSLDRMNVYRSSDARIEAEIKKEDPLFSLSGFYSDIMNKLSTIFFADDKNEALAFAEGDMAGRGILAAFGRYRDVVNADTEMIHLNSYGIKNGFSVIDITANIVFTEEKNDKISKRRETVTLRVAKNASCKTQAICGPSFLRCRGCGASMSLLGGRTCEYCGASRSLVNEGWAIAGFGNMK